MQINRGLLERLPMYTCLETITRQEKTAKQRKAHSLDTVQVDVGVGANDEIYSWPGETAFSAEGLGQLVGHGFVGTGFFAIYSKNVFLSNAAIVKPAEEQNTPGERPTHFSYTIPSLMNHWVVNWSGARAVVGESGEFWIDEDTRALRRLRAVAQDIPPELPLKEITVSIKYQTLSLRGRSVLLPSDAELLGVEWNGATHFNAIGFSRCHVFEADSKLSNSSETLVQALEKYESTREVLPGGLDITIKLDNEIRGLTAKIGDLITARAVKAVRSSGKVLVAQDALVRGRIRAFRQLPDLPYSEIES